MKHPFLSLFFCNLELYLGISFLEEGGNTPPPPGSATKCIFVYYNICREKNVVSGSHEVSVVNCAHLDENNVVRFKNVVLTSVYGGPTLTQH